MQNLGEKLNKMIADPFEGPYEGEDFWVDDLGVIQVAENNVRLAGTILRKVNLSGKFDKKLVRIGTKGDSIMLAFDSLGSTAPVYTAKIGFKGDILTQVRESEQGEFFLYINGKRNAKVFSKMSTIKTAINKLDKEMQAAATEPEDLDD
jgi:hypothetical protein